MKVVECVRCGKRSMLPDKNFKRNIGKPLAEGGIERVADNWDVQGYDLCGYVQACTERARKRRESENTNE